MGGGVVRSADGTSVTAEPTVFSFEEMCKADDSSVTVEETVVSAGDV